jgi:hypothetical protein
MRRRRARGLTLVEILVALGLAGVMSAFMLMLTRGQLIAYDVNDSIVKAQQNARSGTDWLESVLRKACGGISSGRMVVARPGGTTNEYCVEVYGGAAQSGGRFTTGTVTTGADAIELVWGTSPVTMATTSAAGTNTVSVKDVTGFNNGDFVLVTNFNEAALYQLNAAPTISAITNFPNAGTLQFSATATSTPPTLTGSSNFVMKAKSISIYLETAGANAGMLMLDGDGMFGTTHADALSQPLVEGVEDFQIAVGQDTSTTLPAWDGALFEASPASTTDEWLGNVAGDGTMDRSWITGPPGIPWNPPCSGAPATCVDPQYRAIRATLLVKTLNRFPGDAPAIPGYEDRLPGAAGGYTLTTGGAPRFRAMRMTVAPRVWNLLN